MSLGLHLNTMDEARRSLDDAMDAVRVTARLHREHHDALIASVVRALNGEIG